MRASVIALGLVILSPAVHGQEGTSGAQNFRDLAASIPGDPAITSQWGRLLPTIARQCGMTVDAERVRVVGNRAPRVPAAERYAYRLDDRLKKDWDAMARRDLDEACRIADELWGETGAALPGVLRDRVEGTRLATPPLALVTTLS